MDDMELAMLVFLLMFVACAVACAVCEALIGNSDESKADTESENYRELYERERTRNVRMDTFYTALLYGNEQK